MKQNIYKTWAEQSAENTKLLAEEARILFNANRFPRAYYLAHMSTEELESISDDFRDSLLNIKEQLICHINNLKNDTMYVSCKNKTVITPSDKIESVDVESYVNMSEKLSAYSKMLTNK